MNKRLVIISSIVVFVILAYQFFSIAFYGSFNGWLSKCEYTDKIVTAPEVLKDSIIILDKSDEYVAKGKDSSLCSPILSKLQNEIVSNETIDNITVGKKYFEERGLSVERLLYGEKFTFKEIVAQTKHGLSTIDSGSGPRFFLIMNDDAGNEYAVAHSELGFDENESYLGYYKGGTKLGSLTWKYIETSFGENK